MERTSVEEEMGRVQSMVCNCMLMGMTKRQAVALLVAGAGIDPFLTQTIWDRLHQKVLEAAIRRSINQYRQPSLPLPNNNQIQMETYVVPGYDPVNQTPPNYAAYSQLPMHVYIVPGYPTPPHAGLGRRVNPQRQLLRDLQLHQADEAEAQYGSSSVATRQRIMRRRI